MLDLVPQLFTEFLNIDLYGNTAFCISVYAVVSRRHYVLVDSCSGKKLVIYIRTLKNMLPARVLVLDQSYGALQ